jgi:hypothetical protein
MPTTYNKTNFFRVLKALANQGYTGKPLLLALSQTAVETNGFKDEKITSHNNPSGITFINKPTKQKNATKGRILPESPKYNYAKFNTIDDWAVDYNRLVGSAIKSSSDTTSYAQKLADKKYYEVSARYPNAVANYSRNLQFHLKNIQRIIVDNINSFTSLNLPPNIQLTDKTLPILPSAKESNNTSLSPVLIVGLVIFAFLFSS